MVSSRKPSTVPISVRGSPSSVRDAARELEHVAVRSAAAVPETERVERAIDGAVGRALDALRDLVDGDDAVVGVARREVRQQAAAVEAFPPERRVREAVRVVPRQLLRDERAHAGARGDLRQRGGVAEDVGDPQLVALDAELLQEEAGAERDLTDECLAARDVRVGLDPHAADRLPSSFGDAPFDAFPDGRVVLLHPLVLRGLAAHEAVLRVGVHQRELVRERARALADRLAQRPQPRRVDVGVADGGDAVRMLRRLGEDRREDRSRRGGRAGRRRPDRSPRSPRAARGRCRGGGRRQGVCRRAA